MADFLWGILGFAVRVVSFILDVAMAFSRTKRLARWTTGGDAIVEVPPDSKILPAAAQRALDEAEARHNGRAAFMDQYTTPSSK